MTGLASVPARVAISASAAQLSRAADRHRTERPDRLQDGEEGWCILRTSGGRTLAVTEWLTEAGVEAWTPKRVFKRQRLGNCIRPDGTKPTIEISGPIMPTFVFARAGEIDRLLDILADPASQHPAFSIFTYLGKAPLVGDKPIEGFRQAERDAIALIEALRDAESREEADRIRIAAMKTEQARLKAMRKAEAERRKALRAERRDFDKGERVKVEQHDAFAGMTGVVESSDGRSAMIYFGGNHSMKIDAWRLMRDRVQVAAS